MLEFYLLFLYQRVSSDQLSPEFKHFIAQSCILFFQRIEACHQKLGLVPYAVELLGEIFCHFIPNFHKIINIFSDPQIFGGEKIGEKFGTVRISVSQATDRYNFHSVVTGVGHLSAGKHHKKVGLPKSTLLFHLIFLSNKTPDFKEMSRTLFYFTTPELTLYQSIPSVIKMKNCIGFKTVAVMVIG